jgi:hypothetical protein
MKPEKKIPSILGLILLLASIFGGVFLTKSRLNLNSKASGDCHPNNIQLTNVTQNSVDISFSTTSICLVNLFVGNIAYSDLRFNNSQSTQTKLHYFQINNLKADTLYQYHLVSNGETITNDNFHFNTAITFSGSIPTSNLAWGRVFKSSGEPAANSIVYLNIPGAAPLSSIVTTAGNWNISLAASLNQNKTDWFSTPAQKTEEDVVVFGEDDLMSQISSDTEHNNPVPDIILGQNSFSSLSDPVPTDTASLLATITPQFTDKNLEIINPSNGESLSTLKPDFFGKAPVNSTIDIKIESPVVFNGEATATSDGSWHWSPPTNLTPGEHTITATVNNPTTGLAETISHKFIVYASDNSLAFNASASATLITPTSIVLPTNTLTPTSKLPTPTIRTAKPSTTSGIPVTGNGAPTVLFILVAAILLISSYLFAK